MSSQRLTGKPTSKAELLKILDEVRSLVELDDSWEGMVNWLMPEEGDPENTYARVEARYRTGNAVGQGGFVIYGEWVDEHNHVIRHADPGRGLAHKVGTNDGSSSGGDMTPRDDETDEVEGADKASGPKGETATHPPTAPPDADSLPEPAPPSTATGGTTPSTGTTTPTSTGTAASTGDLGSSGVPGGPA